jgi:hypothetical protein
MLNIRHIVARASLAATMTRVKGIESATIEKNRGNLTVAASNCE